MPILSHPKADALLMRLQAQLPESKLRHAISVTAWAEVLTANLGLNTTKAVAAGFLHDMFKKTPGDELLRMAREFNLDPPPVFIQRPGLLHGPVAAEIGKRDYAIDDETYEAVFWHTTGKPHYNRLGQALYFADFSEPFRERPEAHEARAVYHDRGFDDALRYAAAEKAAMFDEGSGVDKLAREFHEWLESEAN